MHIGIPSNTEYEIELISAAGKVINRYQQQNSIDISTLAGGIYFIKICTANDPFMEKFVKQ